MKTLNRINTLAAFIAASHLDSGLVRAVVKQFGGWQSFTLSAPDVCRGGIDGGFHGFIYTSDTNAFAARNRKEIAAMASDQARDFGCGIHEMIRGFGCFRHDVQKPSDEEIGMALYAGKESEDSLPVLNALAWYAGEEVCRNYCDLTGEND